MQYSPINFDGPWSQDIHFDCMDMGDFIRWCAIRNKQCAYLDIPKTTRQPWRPFSSDIDGYFRGYRYQEPSLLQAMFGIRPAYTYSYKWWLENSPVIEWHEIYTKLVNALDSCDRIINNELLTY